MATSFAAAAPAWSATSSSAPTAGPATAVSFVVNSVGDGADAAINGVCQTATAGECTLRAALQEANAAAGPASISFAIPGTGVHTITPATLLPTLTNANGITIDGFTQPGSSPNTDPLVDNAVYAIELKGTNPAGFDGFYVTSSNNLFRGLDMHGFHVEIDMYGTTANHNTVEGDMLGLTPTGALDPTYAIVNNASCLVLESGASYNQIGAPGSANRNVVSGCDFKGIATYNYPTSYNTIQNNIVGLDPTGTLRRMTESHGIDVTRGSEHTLVGGTGAQQGNLVSGNGQAGIEMAHEPSTKFNSIIGNLIGTDATGNNAPAYAANGYWGVHLEGMGDCGTTACKPDQNNETVEYNVITDNGRGGVMVDKGVNNSIIAYNKIGVTANGTAAGNKAFGVDINGGAFKDTVSNNVIANNAAGVQIEPDEVLDQNHVMNVTNQNTITQNSIYNNNQTGTAAPGIDLTPFAKMNTAANASTYVNDAILAPTLSNATPTSVQATTCASCVVELFIADSAAGVWGSGQTYLTRGTADSTGHITFSLTSAIGKVVTATATNPNGSTSEFATDVLMPGPSSTDAPPTAAFTPTCTGLSCSFNAGASTDSDGTIISYSWNFGDGTPAATGVTVQHTFAPGGPYTVTLTVIDNGGATGTTSQSLTVADAPPVASFIGGCTGLACSFDASGSSDPDGGTLTYAWNFGDGNTATGPTTTHTYTTPGPYTVGLTVNDGQGGSTTTSQQFNVAAPNPALVATDSFTRVVASGWGSADTGGAYAAAQGTTTGTASVSNGAGAIHLVTSAAGRGYYLPNVSLLDSDSVVDFGTNVAPAGGTGGQIGYITARRVAATTEYRVRLRFVPGGGLKLMFTKTVGSSAETAIGSEITVPGLAYTAGQMYRMRFDVSGTNPTKLRAKVWLASGTEPSAWTLTNTDSEPTLQVAGSPGLRAFLGASSTNQPTYLFDNFAVQNLDLINQPPVASFSGSCVTLTCNFNGSASTDPDGTIASYSWNFGDGSPAVTTPMASHTYAAGGLETVTLTVTDNQGATGTASQQFSPVAPGGVIAQDTFTRTVASGWGTADLGGVYASAPGGGTTSVNGSAGTFYIAQTTGAGGGLYLPSVMALDTDARVDVSTSLAPAGGTYGQASYITLRHTATNTEYRARLRFMPTGAVKLAFVKTVGTNTEVQIGNEITLAGLSYVAGQSYSMRFDATGTNPTTLQARVWVAGTTEPSTWNLTAADSEPTLQAAGSPGVRVYLGASSTAQPTWQFDNLAITDLG
ncbi:MAG TPA: PKD domain-containing protein [Acidimicrobiia bacterium]